MIALWKIVNGSDQTDSSRLLKRKKKKEVRIFDVGVEAVVHRRAGSFYIRDVEEPGVGPTRKAHAQLPANC